MRIFDKYSLFYNTMYKDKDYAKEAEYINEIISKYQPSTKTILDLGCGTGQHAKFLIKRGYRIHGVDKSEAMITEAKKSVHNDNLIFSIGDIRTVELKESFDVVISLFHVISYLTSNDDLQKTFSTVYNHLKDDGLFIFDCWYGPAVLTERPTGKIKIVENNDQKIIRFTEPLIYANENTVEVKFHFFIHDKKKGIIEDFLETHLMRYLFKPELEVMLNQAGFRLLKYSEFLTGKEPDFNSWSVCFLAEKK